MAYTTINKSGDYFNTKLYSGNGTDDTAITGVGFQPDFLWIKERTSTSYHNLQDAVRGVTKQLISHYTNGEETSTSKVKSFDSDGFTLGTSGAVNENSQTYASWNWKANGSGSANTDGSSNSTVSANTTSGFSIVTYTGTGSTATVGHGLGVAPKFIIIKCLSHTSDWMVYYGDATDFLKLNTTVATEDLNTVWNDTSPTNSVFTLGSNGDVNTSGRTYVAYCFAEKTGYSKFGKYTGNGNADGTFVYTGFKPAFVMVKNTVDTGDNWTIYDNKRDVDNQAEKLLFANASSTEATGNNMDILSNGFKQRNTSNGNNGSGDTYIYMAFAEAPLVGTNGVTAKAR